MGRFQELEPMIMSNQLFKRRQAKENFSRKKANRKIYKALIVCEDSKSAPTYFTDLCKDFKIDTETEVHITGKCGSDPMSVFRKAKELDNTNNYINVYCVIDRDQHYNYDEALKSIADNKFKVINSVICFEVWLLAHYDCPMKPYTCFDELASDNLFKKYFPKYAKGAQGLYDKTKGKLEDAKKNIKIMNKEAKKSGSKNPYSNIIELIEDLEKLKD